MLSLKGRRTGIFTRLNTFHKHTLGFHKAVGRGNFKSMEEAQKWLTTRRRFLKEDSNEILASKKKNLSLVYTDGSYNNSQKNMVVLLSFLMWTAVSKPLRKQTLINVGVLMQRLKPFIFV